MAEYRTIPGIPGYRVKDDGSIESLKHGKFRTMKLERTKHGYLRVMLSKGAERPRFSVHRLVCLCFHGLPKKGQVVRHLDGSRDNNVPSNLCWGTSKENARDCVTHGRVMPRHPKLTPIQVVQIMRDVTEGKRRRDVAAAFNVHYQTVNFIMRGVTWKYLHMLVPDELIPISRLTVDELADAEVA